MMRPFDPCRRFRQGVSLLAAGALPEHQRGALQDHLAACPGCRKYHAEICSVAAPLAGWEQGFAGVVPTESQRQEWAAAVRSIVATRPVSRATPAAIALDAWRQLILPCRGAWAGMAAAWLVLWGIHVQLADDPAAAARGARSSAPAVLRAIAEQRQLLAELSLTPKAPATQPDQPADRPRHMPGPRSELRVMTATA